MNMRHDMLKVWRTRVASLAAAALMLGTTQALADQWNDKTTMRFTSPVRVPGATLPAGEYVFELMDLKSSRHMVQIWNSDETDIIATTHAVPVKRQDPQGTTTVMFAAPNGATAPALKAWYYPGTLYGHEFIYPGDEARDISVRTKTLVLSDDAREGSETGGALRMYQADGSNSEWRADDAVIREWHDWSKNANVRARTVTEAAESEEKRAATAPMVTSSPEGMSVSVGELEEQPSHYIGQTISVDAEVEKVLGPRVFTIDEPNWIDLDGEVLVHMPSALATLVRPDDRVRITGTVRPFVKADFEQDWSWFGDDSDKVSVSLERRPVLVATKIIGGDDDRAMFIAKSESEGSTANAAGTRENRANPTVSSVVAIAPVAVGRYVELEQVKVDRVTDNGFFITSGDTSVFVRPADGNQTTVRAGETVSIDGIVLTMPSSMRDQFDKMHSRGSSVYVYATDVS